MTTGAPMRHNLSMRTRSMICCAALAALLIPASAGAVGLPNGYPRTIAGTGLADSVTVSRAQATMTLVSGNKVRVTAFTTATTTATGRRLVVVVARCSGSASSPVCKSAASSRITLVPGRTNVQRTFTVTRPVTPPDSLRVMVLVTRTSSAAVPLCSAGMQPGAACKGDSRFALGGDLLLSAGTWRSHLGSRLGTVVTAPTGVTVEKVFFNSRTYAWTATSPATVKAVTTIGYPNQPPARTFTDTLNAGVRKVFDRTPSVGTAFETRAGTRTLLYAASVGGAPMFSMQVPVPPWTNNG